MRFRVVLRSNVVVSNMAIVPLVDVGLDKCFPVSTFLRISGGTSLLLAVRHFPALAGMSRYYIPNGM